MQTEAVIWAEPIWGQRAAPKLGGALKSGGGGATAPLLHACYGPEYINLFCSKF